MARGAFVALLALAFVACATAQPIASFPVGSQTEKIPPPDPIIPQIIRHYSDFFNNVGPNAVPFVQNTLAGAQKQALNNRPQVSVLAANVQLDKAIGNVQKPVFYPTWDFSNPALAPVKFFTGSNGAPAFPTTGRKMLAVPNVNSSVCITSANGNPLSPGSTYVNSPGVDNFAYAYCSSGTNTTNPAFVPAGRKLLAFNPPTLQFFGECKENIANFLAVCNFVFDTTSQPTLDLLSKLQTAGGAIQPSGTLSFLSCSLFFEDGSVTSSASGTCFETPGSTAPVVAKLQAKQIIYGKQAANYGTRISPPVFFAANYADTVGSPFKSLVYKPVQSFGLYVDKTGIYPGP